MSLTVSNRKVARWDYTRNVVYIGQASRNREVFVWECIPEVRSEHA